MSNIFCLAFYGTTFDYDEDSSYSLYTLIQYVASVIVYCYSSVLRVRKSIILQMVYVALAMICYIIIEIREHRQSNKNDDTESTVLNKIVLVGINEISPHKY
jgi:Ca2+/Na+ antiporter